MTYYIRNKEEHMSKHVGKKHQILYSILLQNKNRKFYEYSTPLKIETAE